MTDLFQLVDRESDFPLVERIWTARSLRPGSMLSVAQGHCELVVSRFQGRLSMTLRGPETSATTLDCPVDADWVGIRFKVGTFLPRFPLGIVRDRQDVTFGGAGTRSFWLGGHAFEYPTFANAETFVRRLVTAEMIVRDPCASAILGGETPRQSQRSIQRHFARAAGVTYATFRKIERARLATILLRQGIPILDVVHRAGYFDQPHLTRSLRQLIGQTPGQVVRGETPLSYLYKTDLPLDLILRDHQTTPGRDEKRDRSS